MTKLQAALHALTLFCAAGCAGWEAAAPGSPGYPSAPSSPPAAASAAPAAAAPVRVDPQITTALVDLIERNRVTGIFTSPTGIRGLARNGF